MAEKQQPKKMIDSIKNYLIIAAIATLVSGYFAYHFTSEYYQAKIEAANTKAREDVISIQKQGDEISAMYVKRLKELNDKVMVYERQKQTALVGTNCNLSVGFVRLYNASTNGSATSPSSADGAASGVDAATLLDVLIANNIKYNEVADQLTKLQQFEKTNP